jgi:hypothetical protein
LQLIPFSGGTFYSQKAGRVAEFEDFGQEQWPPLELWLRGTTILFFHGYGGMQLFGYFRHIFRASGWILHNKSILYSLKLPPYNWAVTSLLESCANTPFLPSRMWNSPVCCRHQVQHWGSLKSFWHFWAEVWKFSDWGLIPIEFSQGYWTRLYLTTCLRGGTRHCKHRRLTRALGRELHSIFGSVRAGAV